MGCRLGIRYLVPYTSTISGSSVSPRLSVWDPTETFSTSVSYRDGLPIRHMVYKYNIRVTRVSLAQGMRPSWNMKHISIIRRWMASICIQVYQGHQGLLVSRYEAPLKHSAPQFRDGSPIRHLMYKYNIRVTRVSLALGMRSCWNMQHTLVTYRDGWPASVYKCLRVTRVSLARGMRPR